MKHAYYCPMRKAFTLIELALVAAVLGILVSLAVPYAGGVYKKAQISAALSHARLLESAKDSYVMANPGASGRISESDLKTYLPKGFAFTLKTSFGSDYDNALDLDKPVSFTHGGKTYSCMSNEM